jgi:hypothetical protein
MHIFKIYNFKVKNTFEPNVLKWVIKTLNFISSSPFAFLIINAKIIFNFQEWCTFGLKMTFEKNKECPFLRFECFKHAKTFLICVKL